MYNLKNVKNTHGRVLILVKLQASTCNFTKIDTPPWVFFTFFKLYKCYQIAQHITCYLSYPKTACFRYEVENCDINIVEQGNIPKFSRLDYMVTLLRLLELIFDDVLNNMIAGYT